MQLASVGLLSGLLSQATDIYVMLDTTLADKAIYSAQVSVAGALWDEFVASDSALETGSRIAVVAFSRGSHMLLDPGP